MNNIRLNVIDAREAIQGTIHGSVADAVIASLSAEPETIAELEAALDRFCKRHDDHSPFDLFAPGEDTHPWDAGVVIVDLAARIVAAESSYSAPQSKGSVNYHNGSEATDIWLPYHIPDDWLFLTSVLEYQSLRGERRAVRMAEPLLDIRQVLYGRPMIEFIVSGCLAESERLAGSAKHESPPEPDGNSELDADEDSDGSERNDTVLRSLHARWLITPLADLGDRTPREVILAKQSFIDSDLSSRAWQWSLLNEGPPPLSRDSHAYRFAGFGTHEYVLYYDFVRHLLAECWKRINPEPLDAGVELALRSDPKAPDRGEAASVSAEYPAQPAAEGGDLVGWLEQLGQAWLNSPSDELEGRIPGAIIESERRRIPIVMSAKDMIIDENCDLCGMLADETGDDCGPAFWHLDGSHIDRRFEFSTCQTLEEWEAEERRWRDFTEEFERQWGAEHPTPGQDTADQHDKDWDIED